MSKFDKVFEAREESGKEDHNQVKKSNTGKIKAVKPERKKPQPAEIAHEETPPPPSSRNGKQRGRPKAKRSDPAFIGFTTYIRKDTHLSVKIALLQEGKGREMSELVEELLSGWIKNI